MKLRKPCCVGSCTRERVCVVRAPVKCLVSSARSARQAAAYLHAKLLLLEVPFLLLKHFLRLPSLLFELRLRQLLLHLNLCRGQLVLLVELRRLRLCPLSLLFELPRLRLQISLPLFDLRLVTQTPETI